MGACKFWSLVLLLVVFICMGNIMNAHSDSVNAESIESLKRWSKSQYLSCEYHMYNKGGKEIFVVLGSITSGIYSTDIRVFNKINGKWQLLITRTWIFDQVVIDEKNDSLIFRTKANRLLLFYLLKESNNKSKNTSTTCPATRRRGWRDTRRSVRKSVALPPEFL